MKQRICLLTSCLIGLMMLGEGSVNSAQANESIFCSDDAAILLGDVCVDSQGRIPDNADIRGAIVSACQNAPRFVNSNRTVVGFFDAFWGEYNFCTRQIAADGNEVYYLKINFDNSRIYRYNTSTESWGSLDVWEYSTQTGYLRGRLTTFTEGGRALSTPRTQDIETQEMYQNLLDLLAVRSVPAAILQELQQY